MLPRTRFLAALLGFLFSFLTVAPVQATDIEVAPFYGVRFGGNLKNGNTGDSIPLDASGAVGATLNISLPIREKLEFLYSHQDTDFSSGGVGNSVDVSVDVWQAGLLKEYTMYDKFRPFLVGTLGITNFSFDSPLDDQNLFSVGLGGGFKYLATDHIGFRLDGRVYVSFVEGGGSIACAGGCAVQYQGSVFTQGEITPSVIVIF